MNKLSIVYPKQCGDCTYQSGNTEHYVSMNSPKKNYANVCVNKSREHETILEERLSNGRLNKQSVIHLSENNGQKFNQIVNFNKGINYNSEQYMNYKTGEYAITRRLDTKTGSKIINYYSMEPLQRKFLDGSKGKLQKLIMAIAQDSNGCERAGLRNIAGKLLKLIK